ncbi:hypothetical protein PRZ48_008476 [Zasmidium cellare]|uniref:RRM domain-containing protein n=1 Tax=Zasmidium cellare TaxID=395010 RepID=A0ABR0EFL8_ZASCE|nr:hypothetical protein PRZ48_008476 [Zasmidium cellare]
MDQDIRRLIYRNAELETELRLVKEQLARADQTNLYLLNRFSSDEVGYQTPRALPSSRFVYEPQQKLTDLLSFDDAHDSGYYESPEQASPVAAVAAVNPSSADVDEHVLKRPTAASKSKEKEEEKFQSPPLIDHTDRYTPPPPPPESTPPAFDYRSLRNNPVRNTTSYAFRNTRKYNSFSSQNGGEPFPPPDERGFMIPQPRGGFIWVSTEDDPPTGVKEEKEDDNVKEEGVKEEDDVKNEAADEQEKAQLAAPRPPPIDASLPPPREAPRPPPIAPPCPPINPNPPHYPTGPRHPRPNTNGGIHASRWSNTNTNNTGPREVSDLMTHPTHAPSHHRYRTVALYNIPPHTELAKIMAPVHDPATITVLKTSGMKTIPPMDTNTAMLTFQNSVAATRFAERALGEKLWEFEVEVRLVRTGTEAEEGRGKFGERQGQYQQPLWMQIDARGGFDRGAGRVAAMERAIAGDFGGEEVVRETKLIEE